MIAVASPQPLPQRRSIFRRWTQRADSGYRSASITPPPEGQQSRSPNKLQRRPSAAIASLPTPPESPNEFDTPNVKPAKSEKPHMITHVQRIDITPKCHTIYENSNHRSSRDASYQRVLPGAMTTMPFPGTPLIRPWNVFLPPSQIFALYLGYLPKEMSDKWYIYSEGPDQTGKLKVHFHRSWTGMKIAEMFVVMDVKGEGAGKIVGLKWNGTFETNRMTEAEAKYMLRTTCKWTLGVELE